MASITIDLKMDTCTNQEAWDIIDKMLAYAETMGPTPQLTQETNEIGSLLITLEGSEEQIGSIFNIIEEYYPSLETQT